MSHVAHMNESCCTDEWVISYMWMSHVAQMNNWCCFYSVVRNSLAALREALCANHIAHVNEPCRTYEWAMSHVWVSIVIHTNELYHTYEWVMSYIWMRHVTHMRMSVSCREGLSCKDEEESRGRVYEWVMSHIWMNHVTHRNVSCHIYEWVMSRRAVVQRCRGGHRSHSATWPENQGSLYVHIHGCKDRSKDWWT